jgi:hypothetical protein
MNTKLILALLPAVLLACSGGGDDDTNGTAGTGGTMSGTGGTTAATGGTTAATGGTTSGSGGSTSGSGGTTSGTGGSSGGGQCASGNIQMQAANNYTFTSDIKLTAMKVKANEPNLTFDWSGLTTDFLGRPTNPKTDIDSVLLVELNATLEQFEKHLNDDDNMLTSIAQGPLQLLTMKMLTSSSLEDFGVVSQPQNTYKTSMDVKIAVDQYLDPAQTDQATHIFALMPSQGTKAGSGTKMIQLFTVDTNSTTTTVNVAANMRLAPGMGGHTGGTTGPSMSVTYDTSIHGLTPIKVAAGDTTFIVDWSKLTKNGLGRDWVERSLSRMTIGHYTQSLTELENDFFDLDTLATASYTQYLEFDQPTPVSGLKEKTTQAPFPGIDNTGTWILALFCDPGLCGNPAPWFLTVLQTCN